MAALVDGIILTLGTFYVVFVAESFLGPDHLRQLQAEARALVSAALAD